MVTMHTHKFSIDSETVSGGLYSVETGLFSKECSKL